MDNCGKDKWQDRAKGRQVHCQIRDEIVTISKHPPDPRRLSKIRGQAVGLAKQPSEPQHVTALNVRETSLAAAREGVRLPPMNHRQVAGGYFRPF